MKYKFYEKTIYSLLKKTIGIENGRFFPTAGAAIPPAVQEFILSVGINMVAGYGLTESTATVSCENDFDHVVGSVGRIMPHVEVKIGENNEILLRGVGITHGYYKKEAATKLPLLKTDGFIRVTPVISRTDIYSLLSVLRICLKLQMGNILLLKLSKLSWWWTDISIRFPLLRMSVSLFRL